MTVKTPGEIARDLYPLDGSDPYTVLEARRRTVAALEADRAQRDNTIHAAVIAALRERAEAYDDATDSARAADALENEPDEFWMRYGGPLLDQIEKDY